MRQNMKKVICMAAVGALTLVSVIGDNVTSEAAAKTKKIVMNKKKVTLEAGKSFKLKVKKVKPAKASKKVTYKSNKKKVATVSKKGVIKAKSKGKATITVTAKNNKKAKAKVTVTVKKATKPNNDNKTAAPTTPATAVPSNAPSAPSQVPSVSQPPVSSTAPSIVPSASAPAQVSKAPATQKPSTPPTPVKTPNIVDMDKYDINLKDALWTNEWYDRQDNPDGSVTLTRDKGDADYKVGEFGFELPRNIVGDQHKFKSIKIKYKDSTLTDPAVEKGLCGYVFHSVAQWEEIDAAGKDTVAWYDFANNPKEVPHDAAIEFKGSGEVVITSDMDDFSTVRIYDGVIGGKITIESISVEKGADPGVDTPPVDTAPVDTAPADTSSGEEPGQTEKPAQQPVTLDLSKTSTYVTDGADVKPAYDAAKGCLNVEVAQYQGIIFKAPDDGKTYKNIKVTYTSDSQINAYLFDGAMTTGIGQTAPGQHEVTGGLQAAAQEKTAEFKVAAGFKNDCLKAIKFVHVDSNNAPKNLSIKKIELS